MDEAAEEALLSTGGPQDFLSLGDALLGETRRAGPRIDLNLLARCLLADGSEAPAVIRDASSAGLSVDCYKSGAVGELVIIYIDHLGRFEGRITRRLQTGFAVELRITDYGREKLRQKLDLLAGGQFRSGGPGRPLTRRKSGGGMGPG